MLAADRNLLFGILALQMDFVDRDALVAAMNAWVLQKNQRLGDVLVQQGMLGEDERRVLDSLVEKHLARHGGDAQRSLVCVPTSPDIRKALESVADFDVQASLAHTCGANSEDGPQPDLRFETVKIGDLTTPELSDSEGRFRLLRLHDRGGLGEVFVALDRELNREVALKQMQEQHADDPQLRARFVVEAEVTGGLEHPGIVPVYGLGAYPDGRPFYAMRFIRGDNLKSAVERFHADPELVHDEGKRAIERRRLLGRFLDVCNAVSYAHSRGVLHRDLKPGNIMLGKYGETLLVDWGLAKSVHRTEPASDITERTLAPGSGSDLQPTAIGARVGTPAYMSPEQAAGRLDQLGPASDIYSLGATLYFVMTGRPPFQESDLVQLLRKVEHGEFLPPSHVNPRVDPALDAICMKAMALDPSDRYPTVRALVEEIEHWLADEPVSAWREPWRRRMER
jgi:serine/threonine-protein kinase